MKMTDEKLTRKRIEILHVEDNPGDARLVKELLVESGLQQFDLIRVARVAEAEAMLGSMKPDVILLDLSLPDCNGLETLHRMRRLAKEMPIIVMSGLGAESLAIQAVRDGAQDYLVKGSMDSFRLARAIRYAMERHRRFAKLHTRSFTDELTGLHNRRALISLGTRLLQHSRKTGRELAVIYIDLDGLKQINDIFGHHEGDLALIRIAEVLKSSFRASDIVARLGGDEFVVLAIDNAGHENAQGILQRLRDNMDLLNASGRVSYNLAISMGAAHFGPDSALSLEEMFIRADALLYEQKRRKRNAK
jgi:diguanylate cyclase (GGDEF)-like protein